jgi:hypothetical protein
MSSAIRRTSRPKTTSFWRLRVDQDGEEQVEYLGEASAAGERDLGPAPLGLFGGVGAGGGVQQRESGHPVGAWRRISKAM